MPTIQTAGHAKPAVKIEALSALQALKAAPQHPHSLTVSPVLGPLHTGHRCGLWPQRRHYLRCPNGAWAWL